MSAPLRHSDVHMLRNSECVVDLDAQVNGALDLPTAQEELDSSQVAVRRTSRLFLREVGGGSASGGCGAWQTNGRTGAVARPSD